MTHPNPYQLPDSVIAPFSQFITCEYASLTATRQPLTYPVTPYVSPDGRLLDISTGVAYPAKAERARRNPQVALLYSYPRGSGLMNAPTVLVYGRASVRDRNLQENTDLYIQRLKARGMFLPFPGWLHRTMAWYYARIWIGVTPLRVLWWDNPDAPPQRWDAPEDLTVPASDPAPQGAVPPRWSDAPVDWRTRADYAAAQLGAPVLTVVDADGFPVPFRTRRAERTAAGFRLEFYAGAPAPSLGAACLTFHTHPDVFNGQENMVFVGQVEPSGGFTVERCPGDWSLPPKGIGALTSFFGNGMRLRPRVKLEAQRRGQPVPKVNV